MVLEGFSLIVPVHNGAPFIEKCLKEYNNLFSKKFKKFEIVAVCNDCWDNSVEICKSLTKQFPLKVIVIPKRGKGHALITGFDNAEYNWMGFMDADNPFDLEKISQLVDLLKENNVVIASKYLRGKARARTSFLRRLLSLGGFTVSRTIFGLTVRDTQAGAKFFRKNVWETITKNNQKKFTCTGFDFDIEFLYQVTKSKFRIAELYIPFKYEKFSTFRLKYIPGMIKRLLKMRFFKR